MKNRNYQIKNIYKAILILCRIRFYEGFKNSNSNIYNITISNINKNYTIKN